MLEEVYTWVGDVYAVHTVIKSQTGYMMSMDWGTLHCKFSKRNLNMKISTESKLIRTSPKTYIVWNVITGSDKF